MHNTIKFYGCGLALVLSCFGCNHENDRPMTPANGTTYDNPQPSSTSTDGSSSSPSRGDKHPGSSSWGGSGNIDSMTPGMPATGTPDNGATPNGSGSDTTGTGFGNGASPAR